MPGYFGNLIIWQKWGIAMAAEDNETGSRHYGCRSLNTIRGGVLFALPDVRWGILEELEGLTFLIVTCQEVVKPA